MLILPLLILSIILYIIGKRVSSILIFFFFLFDGFQVIPAVFFDTHIGISKSFDFSFIYIIFLFIYGLIKYKDFIPINRISKIIAIYLSFIILCIGVSTFYYHISFIDIIRTSRSFFLVLSYFVLRRIGKEDFEKILKILYLIVLFQCFLFIVQAFTGIALLTGGESGKAGIITRFYNVPFMIYFLVFYAIFSNPFHGWLKVITTIIPSITMFLPLHRSLMIAFIVCVLIGVYIKIGGIKKIKKYIPLLIIIAILIGAFIVKSGGGRTLIDINNVLNGEFVDLDDDFVMDEEATFMFRMAHFFERFMDVTESTIGTIFGVGFMTEDSDYTFNHFDFQIGLPDEATGNRAQLDSSDISWSNFILRYGLVGSIIYLFCFVSLICSFWKLKDDKFALFILLYLILLFFVSFTCDLLYQLRFLILPFIVFDFINIPTNKGNNNQFINIY